VDIYEDKDNARRDEIASLGGQGGGQNVFTAFYDRFKEIREYHRRHPSAQVLDTGDDPEELLKEEPYIDFSGEEAYGKFLDMHELYNRFLNSKFGHPIEYSAFLEEFYQTHQIARHHKLTKYALLSLLPMAHASVSWGGTSSLGISIYNLQEL
jgi:splicing factor 3A subunit 3